MNLLCSDLESDVMVRKIEIAPYDSAWQIIFEIEKKSIREVLSPHLIAIHHIGSTAIFNMAAKPTIDILLVVKNLKKLDACNDEMQKLGYQPMGENGISGRRYYRKLEGEVHWFHLHAFEVGHPDINRHIYFRDYLREHPDEAQAYQELKLQLSTEFPFDASGYTSGKTGFIQAIDQLASDRRIASQNDMNMV